MSRKSEALKRINLSKGEGLELGPLTSPLATKDEATVYYVDHLSTSGLKKHYEGHGIEEDIVPIDHVLVDGSLKKTFKGRLFDYVIASHVIEHIPDMVSWLADVSTVLKEGGIFSLVIPDKRYTFDIARNESRPADVIGAYLDKQTRPTSVVVYDNFSEIRENIVPLDVITHPFEDYTKKAKQYSTQKAYELCLDNLKPGAYVDTHCFVLTPYSFSKIIYQLIEHDLFDYEVVYFKDTVAGQLEFYVSLRMSKKSSKAKKLKTVPKIRKPVEARELELRLIKLEEEKKALAAELHNMETSKSWQVTKPLRKVLSGAQKIRRK